MSALDREWTLIKVKGDICSVALSRHFMYVTQRLVREWMEAHE